MNSHTSYNLLITVVLATLVLDTLAKVYERCELARELIYTHRLPRSEAALWVCIAYHESSFNSAAVGRDGTGYDHGLFQFNEQFWCGKPGQIPCYRLRDNYLQDDIMLAHTVWRTQGLQAWTTYPRCYYNSWQYLSYCSV